jgi:NADH-ubiquinone oxidoreductase chain 4
MIDLSLLITIPVLIMGGILMTTNNYNINYRPKETNNLNYMALLEESHYMIPNVLQKYYINAMNVTANLFPSFLSSSFWYNNSENEKEKLTTERVKIITNIIKKIGIFLSLIVYGLVSMIWSKFYSGNGDYQLLTDLGSKQETWNLNIALGLDGLSLPFILLIGFIIPIVYWSNWSTIKYKEAYYILIIILLELFLLIVFLVIDLVMFYVFFESILPPLFLLIGLYGASQKFRAGYYLFLYTLFGSLFMLLSFVKVGADGGSTFFEGASNDNFYQLFQELIWLILFVSFSVKTPLIPVHIWLPLAHSDANVSGSIILASIVLKLALYGFIRILINIFSSGTTKLTPFFYVLCAISIVYASSTTMRQFDLKVIVAYSSIAHMASSLLGTFSDTLWGIVGSIIFGLAHGFVSPGLFILVGAVLYDRCGSRIINYYRGLTDLNPIFALMFLLFIFGNMGVPLTGNFIGEFLSLLGSYQQSIFITSIGATSIILSAVYSIFTYNRVVSGAVSPYIFTIPDMYRKEFFILLPLLILTIALGIFPSFITSDIEFALSHSLLFTFFPAVFSNKKNEGDIHKIHQTNSNPHNTPVINSVLPSSDSRSINSIDEADRSSYTNSENCRTNDSNNLNIGNPNSEEGNTSFVSLEDKKNKGVDHEDLENKIVDDIIANQLNYESDSDSDLSDFSDLSVDSINSTNYKERYSGRRNKEEFENENAECSNNGNNNSSNNTINENINNQNNNCPNNNIVSSNEYLSSLPNNDYIFITDYLVHINNIFYFSNVTPMQILLLVLAFISYYRFYLICIYFKESLCQCYIMLKLGVKEIFSYWNRK